MRRRAPGGARRPDAGVTLLELLLATGLAAIVVTAVLTVTQNALRIWTRGEASRDAREVASVVLGGIADDLRQVHASSEGDLVVEWVPFDLERDGVLERTFPRIRLVREVSGAERDAIERRAVADAARRARAAAIARGEQDADQPERLSEEELLAAAGVTSTELSAGALGAERDVEGGALAEVLYAVVPTGGEGAERTTGVLLRAERLHTPGEPLRFMTDEAFDRIGFPAEWTQPREIAGGVLWFEPLLATQTSDISGAGSWSDASGVKAAATCWDAWRRGRPDVDVSAWNEPAPGMGRAGDRPLLPRAVRLHVEVERAADRRRAPTLLDGVDPAATTIGVSSTARLADAEGRHVLVGPEWMLVRRVRTDALVVTRGRRGTSARAHGSGTKVLLGEGATLVVPMMLHDDDWGLELDGPGEDAR